MKRFIILFIVLPFFAFSQEKNVISANRVFPKVDKIPAFEKALAAHAQKFHTGTWKWRVFTIESGPDFEGYHITEGPMSWEDLDTREDLGKAHMADWNTNIAPLLTDRGSSFYSVYREDLSSVALSEFSNKIAINHVFIKPGYFEDAENMLKPFKKTWEASGQAVAVYEASSSGAPQFSIVSRYKEGLKERATSFRKPMKERYMQANGEGSWDTYIKAVRTAVDHSWSELLFYHADLSSK